MKKHKILRMDFKKRPLLNTKPIPEQLQELFSVYRAKHETFQMVREIFQQGDMRYYDDFEAVTVAGFIDNDAIFVNKREAKIPKEPSATDLQSIKGPQKMFKYLGRVIAESDGYTLEAYEEPISGGFVDIYATKRREKLYIECCSCRMSKALDFLSLHNAKLWVIQRKISDGKVTIHEFRRGKNWTDFNKFHEEYTMSQMAREYQKLSQNWRS